MTAPTRARLSADHALAVVRTAVAVVCERPRDQVTAGSQLTDLGVDSLARVAMAEIVEQELTAWLPGLSIGDAELGAFQTPGDVVDYVMARR
ncbi:MAG TPA: acyl carrier protein [Mycobacteriales bacterium]|nr:acyl carrier protein [Mycobacteriales bacterium]